MLKLAGILLILFGTSGWGIQKAGELDLRIRELRQLRQMMLLLEAEIRCTHCPLPDLFQKLGKQGDPPTGILFQKVGTALNRRNGKTFSEIWQTELEQQKAWFHLKKQDFQELQELGTLLGHLDVRMQTEVLHAYEERFRASEALAVQDALEKKQLYRYLGVLGGAVLSVLIL